jgi:hypothetical protein
MTKKVAMKTRRQEYDRQDAEHHNGPTFLSSFQYPIPRNANLDGIGMLLLRVEHFKQIIINAFTVLAHAVNIKQSGADGFRSCAKFFNTVALVSAQGLERL